MIGIDHLDWRPYMETLLGIVQVLISVILMFLVLLHSGKDAGLSGAFGIGGGGSSFGGGSLVERNLHRWTLFFSWLFVLNTIVLLKTLDTLARARSFLRWSPSSTRSSCSRSEPPSRGRARAAAGLLAPLLAAVLALAG